MNRADRYRRRRERNLALHAARGPIRPNDVALTIGLLVAASLVLPVVTTFGGVAAMSSNNCSSTACTALVGVAVWVGLALPFAIFVVGVVVCIVRLFGHLRGWRVAAAIVVAEALCLPLAWGLVGIGVALH